MSDLEVRRDALRDARERWLLGAMELREALDSSHWDGESIQVPSAILEPLKQLLRTVNRATHQVRTSMGDGARSLQKAADAAAAIGNLYEDQEDSAVIHSKTLHTEI